MQNVVYFAHFHQMGSLTNQLNILFGDYNPV